MTALAQIMGGGQTVVPPEVCAALALEPGDILEWEVDTSARVQVRRASGFDSAYIASLSDTLTEWESPLDEEAYRDL